MDTICGKCGGKIKYKRVIKEDTIRVRKENDGCCLISILFTICTLGINLVVSYIKSFKKINKIKIIGTCEKCGKTYEIDEYNENEEDTYESPCDTCIYGEDVDDNGWCDEIGDYVNPRATGCEGWEE